MKKLLLLLLCIPLLFTTCKKEDDTPGNNNGTGNFLENQDGSVWVCQNPEIIDGDFEASFIAYIGFYNSNNFATFATDLENADICTFVYEGNILYTDGFGDWLSPSNSTAELVITKHNNNEFSFQIDYNDNGDISELKFEFTLINDSMIECKHLVDADGDEDDASYDLLFIKSNTETNLSCN